MTNLNNNKIIIEEAYLATNHLKFEKAGNRMQTKDLRFIPYKSLSLQEAQNIVEFFDKYIKFKLIIEPIKRKEETMKFKFGDLVTVENNLPGVIVKAYKDSSYDVYVKKFESIVEYEEEDIKGGK